MSTPAQFEKGNIVWYWNENVEQELACVTEVTQHEPAQYHVFKFKSGESTVCGEGLNEPGAVSAL